ncbi:hypothetical protein [Streptomyces sp. sk2.1]|uniref:hypothetical protein n=1 Tax=Streptomyces sp. sk2.1 TaxID=2478959 RepID=UPI0011E6D462|nr:hypothetical protein [Streptomyces sp. sk2.1]TXS80560.1 hypothetical protein EAO76_01855 [Streptomyces sp. sk2.1]
MKKSNPHRSGHQQTNKRLQPFASDHLFRKQITRALWRDVPGEFLRGVAYKLGSGAVTVIILWWEVRH